jgi:hypothetical protein
MELLGILFSEDDKLREDLYRTSTWNYTNVDFVRVSRIMGRLISNVGCECEYQRAGSFSTIPIGLISNGPSIYPVGEVSNEATVYLGGVRTGATVSL